MCVLFQEKLFRSYRLCEKSLTFSQGLNPSHNIHTKAGVAEITRMILNTRPGGLFYFSPNCGSWVWVSRGSTLRGIVSWRWIIPMLYQKSTISFGGPFLSCLCEGPLGLLVSWTSRGLTITPMKCINHFPIISYLRPSMVTHHARVFFAEIAKLKRWVSAFCHSPFIVA